MTDNAEWEALNRQAVEKGWVKQRWFGGKYEAGGDTELVKPKMFMPFVRRSKDNTENSVKGCKP